MPPHERHHHERRPRKAGPHSSHHQGEFYEDRCRDVLQRVLPEDQARRVSRSLLYPMPPEMLIKVVVLLSIIETDLDRGGEIDPSVPAAMVEDEGRWISVYEHFSEPPAAVIEWLSRIDPRGDFRDLAEFVGAGPPHQRLVSFLMLLITAIRWPADHKQKGATHG